MLKSIIANILGRFWAIISSFVFVPFYIDILGFESYSIISFTLIISNVLSIVDTGLTATLSREFSRSDLTLSEKKKTFITLESIFHIIVFLTVFVIIFLSDYIANNWLNLNALQIDKVSIYLKFIAIDIGFQLLIRFYLGGFIGLDKQVKSNIYYFFWALFRNGFIIILIYSYSSLYLFFCWQAFISLVFYLIIGQKLKNELFGKFQFKFNIDFEILNKNLRFALGMLMISLVASINTQMDKLIISKLLTVNDLGFYTLSSSLAMGIIAIVSPISSTLLPKFTSLYSLNNNSGAAQLFNDASHFISIVTFSLMFNMIFFSNDLVWIWTGNLELSKKVSIFLPFMIISFSMLAIAMLPYNIAIANAYTKLNNVLGFSSLLITIPGYFVGIKFWGPIGAAIVYAFVQTIITIIYLAVIRRKYIKEITSQTLFLKNVILPIILSFFVAYSLKNIPVEFGSGRAHSFVYFLFNTCVTFLIVVFISFGQKKIKNYLALSFFNK